MVIAAVLAGMDNAPFAPIVTPLTSQWRVGPGVDSFPIAPGSTIARVKRLPRETEEFAAVIVTVGWVCVPVQTIELDYEFIFRVRKDGRRLEGNAKRASMGVRANGGD